LPGSSPGKPAPAITNYFAQRKSRGFSGPQPCGPHFYVEGYVPEAKNQTSEILICIQLPLNVQRDNF